MTSYLDTNWDFDSKELVEVVDELPIWSAPFGIKLLDSIKYKRGIDVLDIGFGAGFPLIELAMRLGNESKVYGIDHWEGAIQRAEKKIEYYGVKNIDIIRGSIEDIPLENDSIDLIVSNNGLNNVENLENAIDECSRILKPGGQFVQTVNLEETMIEFYRILKKVLVKMKLDESVDAMQEHIYNKRKPLHEYLNLLEAKGFEVSKVDHDAFYYRFVDGTSMLNHFFIRLAFLDSWKAVVLDDKQKDVFTEIELELNEQAEFNGILKLSVPFVMINAYKLDLKP